MIVLLLSLLACKHPGTPVPPVPVSHQVARALAAGSVLASWEQLQALQDADFGRCFAFGALAAASGTAASALLLPEPGFPELDIGPQELPACFGLLPFSLAVDVPVAASAAATLVLREAQVISETNGAPCFVTAALGYVEGAVAPLADWAADPLSGVVVPGVATCE